MGARDLTFRSDAALAEGEHKTFLEPIVGFEAPITAQEVQSFNMAAISTICGSREELMATAIGSEPPGHGPMVAPRQSKSATLVIATRHEITAAGIEALLQPVGYRVVARCSSQNELLCSLELCRPDIILLAENIVRQEQGRAALRLQPNNRSFAIIFLLEERDPITAACLLELDVEGVLLSVACARTLIECIDAVHEGRRWVDPDLLRHLALAGRPRQMTSTLTLREADIAELVSRGLTNKQIARELRLSEGTVKMHLHHVYDKLHLGGRTQLALSMAVVRPVAR